MTGVRMDKWLWAARFFKTRSIAAHACDLGRIECRGQPAKPAREVKIGDLLRIKNDSGEFQVEVLGLSEIRGPAPMAQTLYRETEESRELRLKQAEERKSPLWSQPRKPLRRPNLSGFGRRSCHKDSQCHSDSAQKEFDCCSHRFSAQTAVPMAPCTSVTSWHQER